MPSQRLRPYSALAQALALALALVQGQLLELELEQQLLVQRLHHRNQQQL